MFGGVHTLEWTAPFAFASRCEERRRERYNCRLHQPAPDGIALSCGHTVAAEASAPTCIGVWNEMRRDACRIREPWTLLQMVSRSGRR